MKIESLRQEFNEWHFLDWKLNCAVTETVEEARSLYDRIYKPFHLDQISEREQCFKAWMAGRVFEARKLEDCIMVPINNTTIVAVEKMVEQQVEASGITADVFRLDGEKILNAAVEAARGGNE